MDTISTIAGKQNACRTHVSVIFCKDYWVVAVSKITVLCLSRDVQNLHIARDAATHFSSPWVTDRAKFFFKQGAGEMERQPIGKWMDHAQEMGLGVAATES